MDAFSEWLSTVVAHLGYAEIIFLMALESSLFPVPSELVMIPAGYLAARGQLDPLLATLAGGLGSLIGASANYILGRYAGRAFLLRWGKYFLINEAKYHEAERLFMKNAHWATFIGRLLPVIRHLISLPAGVFGMRLLPFALITSAGATLWCAVLVAIGYYLGEGAVDLVRHYSHEVAIAVVLIGAAGVIWFLSRRRST
ncbi:DedA family protein [Sinimarinibacterium sp. NLF-5-8]|uniref:DedA family protein n=1 Tax=Sinimarinibacterium sp. NLF-5-8 TaxID=2698684 RepID=UPI00137C2C32|nr:DedA family protein [Sinimarinibacterium sp. NLF-5-8]QHS09387.1 DedA family protein [Sinimarinibacterium sp. NLF-5-8]